MPGPRPGRSRPANHAALRWLEEQFATRSRDECWPTPYGTSEGYAVIEQRKGTHVALELDGRPRPPGMNALHSCDNPPCCNPAHLRWGTQTDNADDTTTRGRRNDQPQRGSEHYGAIVGEAQVQEIRRRHRPGRSGQDRGNTVELAAEFGLSRRAILDIVHRKSWTHV